MILPQFTRTADNGKEHALQVEVGEGSCDPDPVEHEVDDGHRQVQRAADDVTCSKEPL